MLVADANTETMNIFLSEVAQQYCGHLVIMQVDQAAWHKSSSLSIPDNIHFILQPPYSPEVNAVEHLWDEIREKYFHNLLFNTIKEVWDTLERAFIDLAKTPDKIRSLTAFPFLNVTH
ncbi:MAG TPA: hypothetical protein ENJ82_07265 [Bacteroidetes bacterium]|nr:hypothetical protein [Bacteroidota bacterium]